MTGTGNVGADTRAGWFLWVSQYWGLTLHGYPTWVPGTPSFLLSYKACDSQQNSSDCVSLWTLVTPVHLRETIVGLAGVAWVQNIHYSNIWKHNSCSKTI